jgi:alpha-D-ribose 1-methylphosphonate 5-triphosphate synthase subunit PhnG
MPPMAREENSEAAIAAGRQTALAILARASRGELEAGIGKHPAGGDARDLKPAEIGLVMLRGRMGGDGAAFNLGEATMSKAVIELATGERGFGHVLGRDLAKARLVAIADALWQRGESRSAIEADIIAPVRQRLIADKQRRASEAAATKVDFFTLVRGED